MYKRLILATGCDEGYYHNRGAAYAEQMNEHSQLENHIICVDFLPDTEQQSRLPNIRHSYLSPVDIERWDTRSVQHGEFLKAIPGEPDDVIFFTDADIDLQRPFDSDEIDLIRSLTYKQIVTGYNAGPNDTLMDEAARLSPIISLDMIRQRYCDGFPSIPLCYNVGATIARRDTWETLCDLYLQRYHEMEGTFNHKAKQQWFISYLYRANDFEVIPMPYHMHTHGHYRTPSGTRIKDGKQLFYNDRLVLMAHSIRWNRRNGSDFP